MPNALIVGAPKCGTTSLADALRGHSDVFIPYRKELSFFHADDTYQRGFEWYQAFFDEASGEKVRLEATPDYFASEKARDRIATHIPNCKMIFVLRDPVARAHSHYWARARTGREVRSLAEVLRDELNAPMDEQGYMLRNGFFGAHLAGYMDVFDTSQLLVLRMEELAASPTETLARVQSFLEIAPELTAFPKSNVAVEARSDAVQSAMQSVIKSQGFAKTALRAVFPDRVRVRVRKAIRRLNSNPAAKPPLEAEDRELLEETYASDIARLETLLGTDLSAWRARSQTAGPDA